ncbi:MAG: hypothetical protein IKN26_03330, partial [Eubacterium sp.]|nr:hypothetical protein [Eubacterium sp.]
MTEFIFKILAMCFIGAVLCIVIKNGNSTYSLLLSAAVGIVISAFLLKNIYAPLSVIKEKIDSTQIDNQYFKIALKAVGIGYLTTFVSEACKDSG